MISKKKSIKKFAKRLYLEVNSEGKKKYSLEDISKKIKGRFREPVHFTTIQKWAKYEDWDGLIEKIRIIGLDKAEIEQKEKLKEINKLQNEKQQQRENNKLVDENSAVISEIYKSNNDLRLISERTLISRLTGNKIIYNGKEISSEIKTNDLIRIFQNAERTLITLNSKHKKIKKVEEIDLSKFDQKILDEIEAALFKDDE